MTPMIDLLTDYGGTLLVGSSVMLAVGTMAMSLFGRPVQRQRLGELALAATMAWLLLACVPLPRWDFGADWLLASAELRTAGLDTQTIRSSDPLSKPATNSVVGTADCSDDALSVAESPGDWADAIPAETAAQPPTSGDPVGARIASTAATPSTTVTSPGDWRRILAVSYAAGVVGCLAWLLVGHLLLARAERIATVPDEWLEDLYASVARGYGVKRAKLLVSRGCRRPAVYGIWRPVIMLPEELSRPENSARLRHVLRHELAHVWRGDARGNLIVTVAFGFLFFHPLFWWIRHRVQFARELIADDWAARFSSKESYADELVRMVAQGCGVRPGTIGVLGVFRFSSPFYRRMKMLIDRRQPLATSLPLAGKLLGGIVGVVLVATMVCVAGVPRAADEAATSAAPDTAESAAADEPSSERATADSSPAKKQPPSSLEEAIRAALKSVPDATVQTAVDPETGRVSVTVGVPEEHFSSVWVEQQRKARPGIKQGGGGASMGMDEMTDMEGAGARGAFSGGAGARGAFSGMEMMMDDAGASKQTRGGGMMGGMEGMAEGMGGMGGMDMEMDMGMGMGGGAVFQIPADQLNRVQIEETDAIRDTLTTLLGKAEPGAATKASVDVSVVRNIRLGRCLVTLIDDVRIPAQTEGPVVEWLVREGDRVERGQLLARIDDRRARLKLDQARGLLEETQGDYIAIKYAEAALEVATAEYEVAVEVNRTGVEVVSKSELRRLTLQVAKSKLQVEQAQRAKNATHAQQAQLALAEAEVGDCRAEAPIDGIVVEVYARVGEWVKSGDPICRMVTMDRLRVEGRLDTGKYNRDEIQGSDVIVEVKLASGKTEHLPGKVTFCSPLTEGDGRCKVVAEIPNPSRGGRHPSHPGMQVTMIIKQARQPGNR